MANCDEVKAKDNKINACLFCSSLSIAGLAYLSIKIESPWLAGVMVFIADVYLVSVLAFAI